MREENGIWIANGTTEDDPGCIRTYDELVRLVEKVGFLPLFQNDIKGFSVEEHVTSSCWWTGDAEHDPWEWRAVAAGSRNIIYGKFFDKKAAFISKEWFPVYANSRRDGYDFDALWDDEKASVAQKKIMDVLSGPMMSTDIKKASGITKGYDGIMTSLQMMTYICVADFRCKRNKRGDEYGWPVTVFDIPERIIGEDTVTAGYEISPSESAEKIRNHICSIYGELSEKQLKRITG